jgi:hypothetical protein
MPARRCYSCLINWPVHLLERSGVMCCIYRCPLCSGQTVRNADLDPIDDSTAKHLKFAAYLRRWDAAQVYKQEQEIRALPEAA